MWNQNQRNLFKNSYLATCSIYGKETFTQDAIKMIMDNLHDLDFEKCLKALNFYMKDPKNKTWPKIADIRAIVNPQVDVGSRAQEIASRLREAITRFGWPNQDKAKMFIGEIGWDVVNRFGGWTFICENHGINLNPEAFYAQARELVKARLELKDLSKIDFDLLLGINRNSLQNEQAQKIGYKEENKISESEISENFKKLAAIIDKPKKQLASDEEIARRKQQMIASLHAANKV